jgi:hypothetical protein
MFKTIKGKKWFVDGVLNFQTDPEEGFVGYRHGAAQYADGTYRTIFGPAVGHNGVVYANSDRNVELAFQRLTQSRFPEQPGLHDHYKNVQRHYIKNNEAFYVGLSELYAPKFEYYEGALEEAAQHHGDTHPKRAARIAGWSDLEWGDRVNLNDRKWLDRTVTYKMKKGEIAKPGKVPRMIGDMGVTASLQGFRVTNHLKNAQAAHPIYINGGMMEFIKSPNPHTMKRVFNHLMHPPGRFYMAIFSDDACFSIREGDAVHIFNLDISKCDASHTEAMFDALVLATPECARDDMQVLVEQCQTPIRINSVTNKRRYVILEPMHTVLYSGSTLTTIINNNANITIGKALSECQYTGPESLMIAAASVGYVITVETCTNYEDIQFLKHSPVLGQDGEYHPMLNLGVMLRASGVCHGDLPGRGDIKARAMAFQAGLLKGMYPYTTFEILRNLKKGAGESNEIVDAVVEKMFQYKVADDNTYPTYEATPASMYRRYGLNDLDVSDLVAFSHLGYEGHMTGVVFDKILGKDYGLGSKID